MKLNKYWIYNKKRISTIKEFPETVFGFIYYISIHTNQGMMYYIGKKQFYSKVIILSIPYNSTLSNLQ